ncbi:hypothetical protein BC830DRAFT_1173470 [Chytriomyces sp. MP71]|nr:hypothetical protein BC830DRAFT_1173470 [Chytriomyces sp. MP71]
MSWENANDKCGFDCKVDGDCPGEERCFADLINTTVCDGIIPGSDVGTTTINGNNASPKTSSNADGKGQASATSVTGVGAGGQGGPAPTAVNSAQPETGTLSTQSQNGSDNGATGVGSLGASTANSGSIIANSGSTTATVLITGGTITSLSPISLTTTGTTAASSGTLPASVGADGLPPLPSCARLCFSNSHLYSFPLSNILQEFCRNETGVATAAYNCSVAVCTEPADKNAVIQYVNSLGSDCAAEGLASSTWTFRDPTANESNPPPSGLSGLWIGLICLFSAIALALLVTVVYFCRFCQCEECKEGRRKKGLV